MATDPTRSSGRRHWLHWPRWRLGTRIVIALVALLLAAQAATLLIVEVAVDRSVQRQLGEQLAVGARVWAQMHDSHLQTLRQSVAGLAADFAFREAMATADTSTALSALANHGQRIDADAAMLMDVDGALQTSTLDVDTTAQTASLTVLFARAQRNGGAAGVVLVDARPYELAMVPVLAPRLIGWVAMGRSFGASDIRDYRTISGLDAAVTTRAGGTTAVYASSLSTAANDVLVQQRSMPGDGTPLTLVSRHFRSRLISADPISADPISADPISASLVSANRVSANSAEATAAVEVLLLADVDQAMQPYVRLKRQILLLATLAVAVAVLVSVLVARTVSRPVARLAVAARRIGAGDYVQPLPVRGNDELSELAGTFNRMQQGILEREAHILHQGSHDSLTGLPNRSHALTAIAASLTRARIDEGCCAVLMLDLNHFKEINDTLGHAFGDRVLGVVAQRLRETVREGDLLARLGGDEFVMLLEGACAETAVERAWALVRTLEKPLAVAERQAQVSVAASIGVAVYPEHADSPDALMRRADIAMYEAKALHACVMLYQPGHDEVHLRQIRLITDLRRARERGELQLQFQPKIDLRRRRVAHVEALLRWTHGELGPVLPDEFIPLAERSGLIHDITWFVLDEGLREAASWRRDGIDVGLAVNLSALDLLDVRLPDTVLTLLQRHDFPPRELILEITESTVMRDVQAATSTMHRLRAMGIKLSIDDFGTGQSSLAQLRSLPVDEIKIDKSFVMRLDDSPNDTVIVRSAIEIGHNMGLTVIAEGVEQAGSLEILRALNCDMVQGYLFSKPVSALKFREWHASVSIDHLLPPMAVLADCAHGRVAA